MVLGSRGGVVLSVGSRRSGLWGSVFLGLGFIGALAVAVRDAPALGLTVIFTLTSSVSASLNASSFSCSCLWGSEVSALWGFPGCEVGVED